LYFYDIDTMHIGAYNCITKILFLHSSKYIIIMIYNFLPDIVAYEHVRDMDDEKY